MKSIIFSTEEVQAILDTRKSQFRKVIDLKDNSLIYTGFLVGSTDKNKVGKCCFGKNNERDLEFKKPKYKTGDILYVRETFQTCECGFCEICQVLDGIVFKADYNNKGEHPYLYSCHEDETYWKPSIHLKQKDARIFLKVTNVRVERLQDITLADMICEGINHIQEYSTGKVVKSSTQIKREFINLWNSTAKDGYKWEDNPYVFIYEFERVER